MNRLAIILIIYVVLFVLQVVLFEYYYVDDGNSNNRNTLNDGNENGNGNGNGNDVGFSSKSLSILMAQVQKTSRPVQDEAIDQSVEEERCKKFSKLLSYDGKRLERRRIFAGGLIADDSWHVIGTNAIESYGIFHSITFIESNRTQNFQPRKLRFTPGSKDLEILQSGIFGPKTLIHLEHFVHEHKELPMLREHMMRESIIAAWKKLGMTRDDIGLIIDMDEVTSRDFLRAAQMCNIPGNGWNSGPDQTCRDPLLRMSFPMAEGSPKCIHKGNNVQFKRFTSAAMVIGACIEGIGDSTKHPPVPRENKDHSGNSHGARQKGWGGRFDFSKIPNGVNGYYPLYNGADYRQIFTRNMIYGGVGIHLHNFFDSASRIRFKYAYFGHVHKHAYTAPLGAMNADMNLFVKCAHNISDEGNRKQRLDHGLEILAQSYSLPEAFQLEGYVDARHKEMVVLVEEDEEEYGRADKFDGHHLYSEHMLTQKGRIHTREKR